MKILQGTRIFLRRFEKFDVESLVQLFSNEKVMEFSSGVKNRSQVEEWLEKCLHKYKTSNKNLYAVVKNGDSFAMGYCGHFEFDDVGGQPETEIGYRLCLKYWGNGFATEAAELVRDFGFGILGLKRQISIIEPTNTKSIRVAKKIGMKFEKEVYMPWYDKPDHLYVIEV